MDGILSKFWTRSYLMAGTNKMLWLYFSIGLFIALIDIIRLKTNIESELEYNIPFSLFLFWSLFVASIWPLSLLIILFSALMSGKSNTN